MTIGILFCFRLGGSGRGREVVRKGGSAVAKACEVQPRLPSVREQEKEKEKEKEYGIAAADVRFLEALGVARVR